MTAKTRGATCTKLRLLLIGLYSEKYPAVGETHGLSAVAGALTDAFGSSIETIRVVDLVAVGQQNVDPVLSSINSFNPNVLGISVPYGTYDVLLEMKEAIRGLLDKGKCVILGGALPSYLGQRILDQVDDRLVIVVGEGECTAVAAVKRWMNGQPFDEIPNLQYRKNGTLTTGPRQLVPPALLPSPYRVHLPEIIATDAQVFVEASRGCSWAECSFCLRGITDIEGKSKEYRRLPLDRLATDLNNLMTLGVAAVTFADEDFLGGGALDVENLIKCLNRISKEASCPLPHMDISATIHSIFCKKDDPSLRGRKRDNLRELSSIGLKKVFLGIESGSPKQLERYRKGHSTDESVEAANIVLSANVRLEVGFIMFDPLCTLEEISENVRFLLDGHLVEYVSSPTSELRLQPCSRYLKLVEIVERNLKKQLYNRELDPNTLSFPYSYADDEVGRLVEAVRTEKMRAHDLTYRLKSLTRFGDGLILGEATPAVQTLLGNYRRDSLLALETGSKEGTGHYARACHEATANLASGFLRALDGTIPGKPMVARAVLAAQNYLNATHF